MAAFKARLELAGFAVAAVLLLALLALLAVPGSADARKQASLSHTQHAHQLASTLAGPEDYDDPAAAASSFCALVAGLSLPASQACG